MNSIKLKSFWFSSLIALILLACTSGNPETSNQTLSFGQEPAKAVFLDASGKDKRIPMTSKAFPWSSIGRLYHQYNDDSVQLCTATLVGRSIAVTAAHCVLNNGQLIDVTFQASYNQGAYTARAHSQAIKVGTTNPNRHFANDWAVIHLDSPIGDKLGFMSLENIENISSPILVNYSGYSNNFKHSETAGAEENCSIKERFNHGIYANTVYSGTYGHDCSMSQGGSGGPLFTSAGHLLAIATREHGEVYTSYSSEKASIGVMSQDFVDAVTEFKKKYD